MDRKVQTSTEERGPKNAVKRNCPCNLELLRLADIGLGEMDRRTVRNKAVYSELAACFPPYYESAKWRI